MPFDRRPSGELHLTAEAAHSLPRIVHHADGTGRAIEEAMMAAVRREPNITVLTGRTAIDLLSLSHHSRNPLDIYAAPTCVGAYVFDHATRQVEPILAKETVLATGGLGRIFLHTTNPAGACGDGVAMAYRAGARCVNMQFVQFHPTTLYHRGERFLLSEALRGEGARLVDANGREFMVDYHPDGSLAPRDIVARGIHQMMHETGAPCAYLDITHKPADWVRQRFPTVDGKCREAGFDLATQPIPVVPGRALQLRRHRGGRRRAVEHAAAARGGRGVVHRACTARTAWPARRCSSAWCGARGPGPRRRAASPRARTTTSPTIAPWQYETEPVDPALVAQDWLTIRQTMWNYVGLVRNRRRLDRAHEIIRELQLEIGKFYARAELTDGLISLRNGVQTALAVLLAAIESRESRGCHYRTD